MPEIISAPGNVKVVLIKYICDKCGKGQMQETGTVLGTYPERYVHKCDHCAEEISFDSVTYPRYKLIYEIKERKK